MQAERQSSGAHVSMLRLVFSVTLLNTGGRYKPQFSVGYGHSVIGERHFKQERLTIEKALLA